MALSECCIHIDSHGQELVDHGSSAFPVACYQDDFNTMNVPWHWHPEWEAVRIVEGSCTVAAGQHRIKLSAGDGFFVNSGVLHGCWDLEESGCIFHSLVFHPRLVGGSLDSILYHYYVKPLMDNPNLEWIPLSPLIPWQQKALEAIETAWQSCLQEEPGFEFTVRSALSSLILVLWKQMPAVQMVSDPKSLRNAERIKIMLSFIHENYGNELDVARIAATVSISESECLRCFRTSIGITPIQYLKQYRLQQAAKQLLTTSFKISDIAGNCGFSDMSYFTKVFRQQLGCTPSDYRKAKCRSD